MRLRHFGPGGAVALASRDRCVCRTVGVSRATFSFSRYVFISFFFFLIFWMWKMMKSVAPPPPFSLSQTIEKKKKKKKIYKNFSKDFFPFFRIWRTGDETQKGSRPLPGGSKDPGNAHHSSVHSDDFFFLLFQTLGVSFFSLSRWRNWSCTSSIHIAHPNNLVFLFPP